MDPFVKAAGDPPARAAADPDPSADKPTAHASTPSSLAVASPVWARGLDRPPTVETKRPLRLLDLPLDVLRDIIGQVGCCLCMIRTVLIS
jgi:hypothetical protein